MLCFIIFVLLIIVVLFWKLKNMKYIFFNSQELNKYIPIYPVTNNTNAWWHGINGAFHTHTTIFLSSFPEGHCTRYEWSCFITAGGNSSSKRGRQANMWEKNGTTQQSWHAVKTVPILDQQHMTSCDMLLYMAPSQKQHFTETMGPLTCSLSTV